MSIMAKYARIIWAEPVDEDVAKRNKAVVAIQSYLSSLSPRTAVEVASALTEAMVGGALPDAFAAAVEKEISAESQAFVREGHELQIVVCSLAATVEMMKRASVSNDGWDAVDALAAALWSSLSFQRSVEDQHLEGLRRDVLEACRHRVADIASVSRARQAVPDVGTLTIPEADPAGSRANTAYKKATAPVIKALSDNAELDREEIDFLWWVLADHSGSLGLPMIDFDPTARAVISGIDGAAKLRRLPDDGHRHVVLRQIVSGEPTNLATVVAELGAERERLTAAFAGSWIAGAPAVFPLLTALMSQIDVAPIDDRTEDAREWGARAFLEAAIFQMDARKGSVPR